MQVLLAVPIFMCIIFLVKFVDGTSNLEFGRQEKYGGTKYRLVNWWKNQEKPFLGSWEGLKRENLVQILAFFTGDNVTKKPILGGGAGQISTQPFKKSQLSFKRTPSFSRTSLKFNENLGQFYI